MSVTAPLYKGIGYNRLLIDGSHDHCMRPSRDKEGRLVGIDWRLTYVNSLGVPENMTMKVVYTYSGLLVKESITFDNHSEVIKQTNTYKYLPIK